MLGAVRRARTSLSLPPNTGTYAEQGAGELFRTRVLSFVDGSFFARDFLSDAYRSRLQSCVRPVYAVLTAGPLWLPLKMQEVSEAWI